MANGRVATVTAPATSAPTAPKTKRAGGPRRSQRAASAVETVVASRAATSVLVATVFRIRNLPPWKSEPRPRGYGRFNELQMNEIDSFARVLAPHNAKLSQMFGRIVAVCRVRSVARRLEWPRRDLRTCHGRKKIGRRRDLSEDAVLDLENLSGRGADQDGICTVAHPLISRRRDFQSEQPVVANQVFGRPMGARKDWP